MVRYGGGLGVVMMEWGNEGEIGWMNGYRSSKCEISVLSYCIISNL